ncbi:hypothetical protein [Streptomyces sp. NPDC046685]|uniref:hypothetical protein n=1 Tax=Streptomyces sp. NPDC046685 TaxID=3157202 RepID=UPI0033FF14E4
MSTRTLTMPGSTDQFVITERPTSTRTRKYRPLPEGMTLELAVPMLAEDVTAGDVVTGAFFPSDSGIRRLSHIEECYAAAPVRFGVAGACTRCDECADYPVEEGFEHRAYNIIRLAVSEDREPCALYDKGDVVAVIPAAVAAQFPALGTVPPEPELFTVDGTDYGPYEALPIDMWWHAYGKISVTRDTAAQIATDLVTRDAGCGLTAEWKGDWLVFTWDERYRDEAGRQIIEPDADGRYLVGGLWPWMEYEAPEENAV